MRPINKFAGLVAIFLLNSFIASAEPVLRGFYIDNLPAKATSKELSPDKSIILAHILNCENTNLESGKYQIGVELDNRNGQKKTFIITPKDTIEAGTVKTFRLAVPKADIDTNGGTFKVFSKINDEMLWSNECKYIKAEQIVQPVQQPMVASTPNSPAVTTLYVEAPDTNELEASNAKQLPIIHVETEIKDEVKASDTVEKLRQKLAKVEQERNQQEAAFRQSTGSVSTKIKKETKNIVVAASEMANATKNNVIVKANDTVKNANNVALNVKNEAKDKVLAAKNKTENKVMTTVANKANTAVEQAQNASSNVKKSVDKAKNKVESVKEEVVAVTPRKIDPNEFKKLKTIDEELIIYVIKEGDTLKSISNKYYGTPAKERVIADLNFIEKTSSIRVGEEIIVDVKPLGKAKQG